MNRNIDIIDYKMRNGAFISVDISDKACSIFGLKHMDYIDTNIGKGSFIGVSMDETSLYKGSLVAKLDNEEGASFWSKIKTKEQYDSYGFKLLKRRDSFQVKNIEMGTISSSFSEFLFSEKFSDVSFTFREHPEEKIHSHKMILCMQSEYFKSMFCSDWLETKQKEIELDVEPKDFRLLLKCVYSQKIPTNLEELMIVAHLADQYLFVPILRSCLETMSCHEFKEETSEDLEIMEQIASIIDRFNDVRLIDNIIFSFVDENVCKLDLSDMPNIKHRMDNCKINYENCN